MIDIFDFIYDKLYFDINKPIRLFEAFSGIGTQAMALKRLGYQVDHVGISEIDKHALKSYYAIHGEVKNYGGIGSFERMPKDIDICSWSFPCSDISLAGKQRGMKDGTRSNYGYVFLDTIENTPYEERPKVLLMENVKALLSETFSEDWKKINLRLERLGYKNYADSLIATDFGVPQTRDRVFIVSIKGEYSYTFPKPFKLQKKLKDYLETKVDEKYYLSDKQLLAIFNANDVAINTIKATMCGNQEPKIGYALSSREFQTRGFLEISPTLVARDYKDPKVILEPCGLIIPEATKQGYSIAEDGDGIYINRPHQKRGVVQKGKIQTIKTSVDDIGVVLLDNQTLQLEQMPKNEYCIVILNGKSYIYINGLWYRIRKLTPLEAWRLMGIDDEDFYKAKASGMSDSQLYKQAGNAIVVDVLYYIFKQFIKGVEE